MRVGPDLSTFGDELPDLEELLPEELQYLCDVCRMLNQLGICRAGGRPAVAAQLDPDFEAFDPDELGLDPEDDVKYWRK